MFGCMSPLPITRIPLNPRSPGFSDFFIPSSLCLEISNAGSDSLEVGPASTRISLLHNTYMVPQARPSA